MNKSQSEPLIETSSNSTVSSTMKRVGNEDSPNFNIDNMINTTQASTHSSEKLVPSSSSPISTTQILPAEKNNETLTIDAASSSSTNNKSNISNPDTTTVQGNFSFN